MVNHDPLNAAPIGISDEVDERDLSFGSDTDRQLVGEVAHGVQPTSLEDEGRQLFVLQFSLGQKENLLVSLGREPSDLRLTEDDVEQHEPLGRSRDRRPTTVPIVRLANRSVKTPVMDVVVGAAAAPAF